MKSNVEHPQIKSKQSTSSYINVFVPMTFWTPSISNYKADFYVADHDHKNNPIQFANNFNFTALATSLTLKNKNQKIELADTDKQVVDLVKEKQGKYHMMLIVNVRVSKSSLIEPENNLTDKYLQKNTTIIAANIISVRAMQNEEYTSSENNSSFAQEYKRPDPDLIWPQGLVIQNPSVIQHNTSLKRLDETINAIQHTTIKEKARNLYNALQHAINLNDDSELVLSIINQTTQLLETHENDIDFNVVIDEYLNTANKIEGSPSIAWALIGAAMSALGVALITVGTLVCVGTLGLGIPIGAAMIAGGSVLTTGSSASFFHSRRTGLSVQMMELVDDKTNNNDMDVDVKDTAPNEHTAQTKSKTRQSETTPTVIIHMPSF